MLPKYDSPKTIQNIMTATPTAARMPTTLAQRPKRHTSPAATRDAAIADPKNGSSSATAMP